MKTILEIDYDLDSDDTDYAVTGTVYMNGIVEYVFSGADYDDIMNSVNYHNIRVDEVKEIGLD